MAKRIALLFAGQGAQKVGMGLDLPARFPEAAELFRQSDQILGRSLSEIAWRGPLEELTKTSNCQPALYQRRARDFADQWKVTTAPG